MILLTKSPGSPKSFLEAPRKLQKISGQKSCNNFVGILEEVFGPKGHSEINWPLTARVLSCCNFYGPQLEIFNSKFSKFSLFIIFSCACKKINFMMSIKLFFVCALCMDRHCHDLSIWWTNVSRRQKGRGNPFFCVNCKNEPRGVQISISGSINLGQWSMYH